MIHVPIRASFCRLRGMGAGRPVRPHTLRPVDPYPRHLHRRIDAPAAAAGPLRIGRIPPCSPTPVAGRLTSTASPRPVTGESAYATSRGRGDRQPAPASARRAWHRRIPADARSGDPLHGRARDRGGVRHVPARSDDDAGPSVVDKDPMHAPIPGEGDLANVGTAFAFITLLAATLTPDNVRQPYRMARAVPRRIHCLHECGLRTPSSVVRTVASVCPAKRDTVRADVRQVTMLIAGLAPATGGG